MEGDGRGPRASLALESLNRKECKSQNGEQERERERERDNERDKEGEARGTPKNSLAASEAKGLEL